MTNKIDPKTDWDMIAKMAEERATRGQIAELYGVTPPAISYILKQMGKSSVTGARGRKRKGYSLADSPSPTLREEARRRGLIAKKQKPAKNAKGLPKTETGDDVSSSESDEKFKPWEYGEIYDPDQDRLVSSQELIERANGPQSAGRAPRAKRKPRKTAGGRGKTSKSGQGKGYREVAVRRISTGRPRAGSGAGVRESANLTQLIQSDIVRDADRLKELCDILTEAAKGPTAPRNTYRQEVANKVREIQKAIADIEGTLLKL